MSTRPDPQEVLVPTEQATVAFYDRELVAVRLPDGRIAAVLRWLCEGMGIDVQAQLRRIQRKAALQDELVVVRVETEGGPQAMPALNLHGLPGWLYGIDETRIASSAAQEAVIRFQREATDVLYRHFSQRPAVLAAPANLVPTEPIAEPEAPGPGALPAEWLRYHQQMIAFIEWQQDIERWRGTIESRLEGVEEITRLVPEILERLGPQTLSAEHQASVQAMAKRLHDLGGASFGSIYGGLNQAFHVGGYKDIPEARWPEVADWLTQRIDAAGKRRATVPASLWPTDETR